MIYARCATISCDEVDLETETIIPSYTYQDKVSNLSAYSPSQLIAGTPLTAQQAGVPLEINEWMVGSKTNIINNQLLLEKIIKKRYALKPGIASTTSPKKWFILTYPEPITENIPFPSVEVDSQLESFMSTLNITDRDMLRESLINVTNLSFVKKIEFEEFETPTIIIRLSEMNREVEEIIYQMEYDLLKSFKDNVDFLVFPL